MFGQDLSGSQVAILGDHLEAGDDASGRQRSSKKVFLDSTQFYSREPSRTRQVMPAAGQQPPPGYPGGYPQGIPIPMKAFSVPDHGMIFETLKPLIMLLKGVGLFPVAMTKPAFFQVTSVLIVYTIVVFLFISAFIGYIKWDKVEMVRSAEGKFEEAVIDYLFTVYLIPVIILPISLYEARKIARVFSDWVHFESVYKKITNKRLPIFMGNKPLLISLVLPLLGCGTMVVTHVTMVHFRFLQVVPYCLINTLTYLISGTWYIQCDIIGKVATIIADDFEKALRHIGPSSMVADYRTLWMILSKQTRDTGNAMCYVLTFLCLYLFLIITLTIYGLLSQIQEGFGIKDIGLTITAVFAVALLYFICDEAHYASNCVRVYFQKKLLLVELSWMNEDAQQEIYMFLRATEMNPTDMNLGGFFDVNRNLFKSLLATMVTYLVVLLQFQISIPEDTSAGFGGNVTTTTMLPTTPHT